MRGPGRRIRSSKSSVTAYGASGKPEALWRGRGEQETEKETRKSKEEADKQLPVQSSSANQTIHLHVPQFLLLECPWRRQNELFGPKSLGAQQAPKGAFSDLWS